MTPKAARGFAATLYAAALAFWLPLYLYNGYYQLVDGKAALFYLFTLFFALAAGLLWAAPRWGGGLPRRLHPAAGGQGAGSASGPGSPAAGQTRGAVEGRPPRAKAKAADLCLLGLIAVYGLNTLLSPDPQTAFFGLAGRRNGALILFCCATGYGLLRALGGADLQLLRRAFLASAGAAAALGWLNYFMADPLDLYYSMPAQEGHMFLSTMGNINFFGALMAMAAAVALQGCAAAAGPRQLAGFTALSVLFCSALIPANSDGAYLAFCIGLAALLCDRRRSWAGAARVLLALGLWLLTAALAGAAAGALPVRGPLRTLSALACSPPISLPGAAACLLAARLLWGRPGRCGRFFRRLAAAAAAAGLALTVWVNCTAPGQGVLELLRFGPRWGANRGYVWGRLWYLFFNELFPLQRLIGVGGDGVNALLNPHYTEYLVALNGSSFDSAHNVYLQQLLCGGLVGLGCWCGFWAGSLRRAAGRDNGLAPLLAVYCTGAFFSIDMPALLPLAFAAAALAGSPAAPLPAARRGAFWTALAAVGAAGMLAVPALL